MSDSEVSFSAISANKLQEIGQQAEVSVFKKALDQQGKIANQLIEGATENTPAPGVGNKLNVIA